MTWHKRQSHKDVAATKAAGFLSRGSYVSTIVRSHFGGPEHQCLYLAGADAMKAKDGLYARDRGCCAGCQRQYHVSLLDLNHREHGTKMSRCWHPSNLDLRCNRGRNCHATFHHRMNPLITREMVSREAEAIK